MSGTGDYILGVIGLVAVALSMAIAGRTARRAALPGWTGTPALLADAVLAVGILVTVSELLGLVGVLDGVLLVVACLIVGGGALRLEPMLIRAGARVAHWGKAQEPDLRRAPPAGRIELGVAIVLALIVAAQWAGPTLLALDRGIYGGDSLWYHLPLAAHIAGTGSVTGLLYTDPLYLNWFYPQVSELVHAGGILLFSNDFLSPLINMAWLGLALFAGYCIGRPYGTGPTAMAAVGSVMAANLLFSRQPGNANNDVVAIALFLSSVALLLNSRWPARFVGLGTPPRPGGPPVGHPAGRRPGGGPCPGNEADGRTARIGPDGGRHLDQRRRLPPPRVRRVDRRHGGRRRLLVRAQPDRLGQPVPLAGHRSDPSRRGPAGSAPVRDRPLRDRHGIWGRFFTPALHERLGELWPAYLALAVIAVLLLLWRGGRMERMLAVVALVAAVAYLLTPLGASGPENMPVGFRLNIRYLAPGLVLALTLLAIPPPFARESRAWRLGTLAIFAVLIVVSAGAVGAIDTGRIPGTVALALTLVALPLLLLLLSRRGLAPVPLAGIGLAALIALAVLGRMAQTHYLDERYSSTAPDYPKTEQPAVELGQGLGAAYDWADGTHDLRIALSGTMGALFQYGLWGGDSSNQVTYIGQHGPRGSFNEIPECPEWIGALNDGDYDYVVTTPTYHQDDPAADTAPVQREWISRAGNVQRVAGAGLVDVWKVTGPLDPSVSACLGVRLLAPTVRYGFAPRSACAATK